MRLTIVLALSTASLFAAQSVHEFSMKGIDGKPVDLKSFAGHPVLFINVASQCGYTPQYKGLEALYRKYKQQGLVLVGVPANNFGGQEPGSDTEIATFCKRNYDVTFPMMSKVSVKGGDAAPLYQFLTSQTGGDIRWNFTKILVGKDGKVIRRFESNVDPGAAELSSAIEAALK
jgi:glutathione peroxidase